MVRTLQRTSRGLRRSQRDYSEQTACLEKRAYANWAGAETEVLRIIDLNIVQGHPGRSIGLGTYTCPYCSAYHVGHSRGPDLRTIYARRRQSSASDYRALELTIGGKATCKATSQAKRS